MVQPVNLALIGTGYWGTKLLREYLALSTQNSKLRLFGVVDSSKERLSAISNEFGISTSKLFTDYEMVLNNPEVNAVHIATPNRTHYQIAIDAINKKKHVLLEKPMTPTTREAFKLARQAEKNGCVLLVDHIYRFNNSVNMMRELVEKGVVGEPCYMELRWTTFMAPPDSTDIIFDLAPHPVDIINYTLDEWPIKVAMQAKSFCRKKIGLEEAAFITANMPNGEICTITLSWIQQGPKKREVILVGSDATLCVDTLAQNVEIYSNGKNGRKVGVKANNTIATMINHFIDAVTINDPPNNSSLVGCMTIAVLECMRRSLEKEITVPTLVQ